MGFYTAQNPGYASGGKHKPNIGFLDSKWEDKKKKAEVHFNIFFPRSKLILLWTLQIPPLIV